MHELGDSVSLGSSAPLDECDLDGDGKVLPLSVKTRSPNPIAEDPLTPRPGTKRKAVNSGQVRRQVNGQATSGQPMNSDANFSAPNSSRSKASKGFRQLQTSNHQLFADELRRLEAQAERINQILAERAQRVARDEQSYRSANVLTQLNQQRINQSGRMGPDLSARQSPAFSLGRSPAPLEEEDTEKLKEHAQRVRQRLAELELAMETAAQLAVSPIQFPQESLPMPSIANQLLANYPIDNQPVANRIIDPAIEELQYLIAPDHHLEQQVINQSNPWMSNQCFQDPQFSDPHYPAGPSFSNQSGVERHFRQAHPRARRSLISLQRLGYSQILAVPRKPVDWIGDAILWMVVSAIARVSLRYLLGFFPFLSAGILLLTVTPAILAVFLAIFVPKVGWVPYYRLFLIMVGLLVGGKL
jgi:hypothetical protein